MEININFLILSLFLIEEYIFLSIFLFKLIFFLFFSGVTAAVWIITSQSGIEKLFLKISKVDRITHYVEVKSRSIDLIKLARSNRVQMEASNLITVRLGQSNAFLEEKNGRDIPLFIIFRFTVTDVANNVAYVNSQNPNFNISNYFNNLFDFYFSHGSGIFFTLAPLVFLIFYGRDKKTKFKIYSIIFIGFVLSIYDGSHGGVSGGRYSIPFFMMFLEEYLRGYKKIYQEKKKILILISLITLLNLPSLEYRNFVISEYQNKTIITKKPLGPANIENKNNEIKFVLYDWPINNLKFNNIIFSNLILYSKIFDNTYIEIDKDLILETNFIFPQTGIGRLIYINDKNIDSGHQFINKFANELNIYLKILYYLTAFIFLIFYFFCIYKVLKIKNKYE